MNGCLIAVILAGGKGERFWPLSRKHRPKQFLSLDGSGKSLLQASAERLLPITGGWGHLWVVTSSALATGVQEQLPQLLGENLLAEPEGRDTAPAVAWSTLEISKRYGENAIVGFFPADPWIADQRVFQQTLKAAAMLAATQPAIVTLGVKPSYPATSYGYIEQGKQIGTFADLPAYKVNRFTEKPNRQTAEAFLATERFSWNSGIFIFQAGVLLNELRRHAPEIIDPLTSSAATTVYPNLPKTSIDYALMEKTEIAYVLPADFGWDDLGDWNALKRLYQGNAVNVELANHVGVDTKGTVFYASDPGELIVTIGLEDLVIVRDQHVTLIVKQDRTQEIKHVLQLLKNNTKFIEFL